MTLRGFKEKHYILSRMFQTRQAHGLKVKAKLPLSMPWRHTGGRKVQLHTFLTAVLDGDEWLTSFSGHLTIGKQPQYPLNGRLGGLQSQSKRFGEDEHLLPLMEFEPRTVQPVL